MPFLRTWKHDLERLRKENAVLKERLDNAHARITTLQDLVHMYQQDNQKDYDQQDLEEQ